MWWKCQAVYDRASLNGVLIATWVRCWATWEATIFSCFHIRIFNGNSIRKLAVLEGIISCWWFFPMFQFLMFLISCWWFYLMQSDGHFDYLMAFKLGVYSAHINCSEMKLKQFCFYTQFCFFMIVFHLFDIKMIRRPRQVVSLTLRAFFYKDPDKFFGSGNLNFHYLLAVTDNYTL